MWYLSQKTCRDLHSSIVSKYFVQYFKKSLKIRIGQSESTNGEEGQAEKKGKKKNDWQKKWKTEDRVTPISIPSEVEEGQALQWPKETWQNDKQWSTKRLAKT